MTLNLHNFGLLWPLGMFDHSFESSINPLQDYDTLWPGDQNNWQFNQGGKILSNLSKQNTVLHLWRVQGSPGLSDSKREVVPITSFMACTSREVRTFRDCQYSDAFIRNNPFDISAIFKWKQKYLHWVWYEISTRQFFNLFVGNEEEEMLRHCKSWRTVIMKIHFITRKSKNV